MKRFLFSSIAAMLISISLTSCKDDKILPILTGKVSAKVDGTDWVSTFSSARIQDSTIIITGTNSTFISLSIKGLTPQTYTANVATANIGAYSLTTTPSASDLYSTNSGISAGGEITLSEIDIQNKFVSGSFSFKVINATSGDAKNITEGTFTKIPLQ